MILVTYLSPWFLVDDLHDAILATIYAVYILAEVPAILSCSTLCACTSYMMCCMQGETRSFGGKTPKSWPRKQISCYPQMHTLYLAYPTLQFACICAGYPSGLSYQIGMKNTWSQTACLQGYTCVAESPD